MQIIWGFVLIVVLTIIIVAVYKVGFNDGYTAGQVSRYLDEMVEKRYEMRNVSKRN